MKSIRGSVCGPHLRLCVLGSRSDGVPALDKLREIFNSAGMGDPRRHATGLAGEKNRIHT